MRNLKYTAALAAAALLALLPVACTDDPADPVGPTDPTEPAGDLPIRWDVKDVAASADGTRVMIGNVTTDPPSPRPTDHNKSDFFVTLQEICTVPEDGSKDKGFAIGLFSDYSYKDKNGEMDTVYNFYCGARLVYLPDVTTNDQVRSQWETDVAMKYWHPGATYVFRAYYPQRLHGYTVSTSNATTFALVYPSRKLQYDMLLGVEEVNATADQMKKAVELHLHHALAALRFQFRLNFEDTDILTSVYLLNDEERHFFTQGTVVYGERENLLHEVWLQDYNPPATEMLYKWVPPRKYWYGVDSNGNDVVDKNDTEIPYTSDFLNKLGYGLEGWKDKSVFKDNPVLMYSEKIGSGSSDAGGSGTSGDEKLSWESQYTGKYAEAYFGAEDYYEVTAGPENNYSVKWIDRDSTNVIDAADMAAEGSLYCRNSGWLLIPPQESYGKLWLCFTTKRGGRTLYKVRLPKKTGTRLKKDGTLITESTDGTGSTGSTGSTDGTDGTDATNVKDVWAAGKRYTYLVTISESNLEIDVSIKDWNERKHSTEIVF